ncbi:MAG TPA: hypothetical protein VGC18_00890 [Lacisediminihabitans sp.]|uniref:hypothetical protein n=1 Tax=Lacisediminihabitans sp. TaxID=2787631 RepID=UPI002EDB2D00
MGFSLTGLVIAAVVFAPSLLLIPLPPAGGIAQLATAGPVITALERVGQVSCILLLCLSGRELAPATVDAWFVLLAVCILVYYGLWARYLTRGRDVALLFRPLWIIPIPMAVFPVLTFAFAAAWSRSSWLAIATVVLAAGHLTNSWYSYRRFPAD